MGAGRCMASRRCERKNRGGLGEETARPSLEEEAGVVGTVGLGARALGMSRRKRCA
jgi:hypothetical protein